ncbi:acetate uptake transporter [Vibrio rumoiensis]|uniref:Uncharacterized protein n=1 Tax=Vibrio rumoiensis 1S-45 TaxID=1188252 RepID=A0A1E5E2U0_9VIBR|nr:GPR1/FUN34/YaaH family transporter [Vibrio rumoiensis]OEF25869.1 hypothetical protein A1QC_08095 [Vibrio rumoiensis 1S-45]
MTLPTASPQIDYSPLGLLGFSMTSIVVNLHGLSLLPLNALIISMALLCGGLTQLFVGLLEYKNGRSFSGVTFCAYGIYWLSFVSLLIFPQLGWESAPTGLVGCYFILWGLFTGCMTLIARQLSRLDFIIFSSLAMVYFLLALHQFIPIESIGIVASLMGLVCGGCAFYLAVAKILYQELGRTILPIGLMAPERLIEP